MDAIPGQIILQVVLILLNAFFAMTEIAIISLSAVKLRRLMEEGDKTAGKLLKLVEEPAGFLSTIQIGITLAGFLGSAFAADNFAGYLTDWLYNGLGFTALSMNSLNTISVILITIILSYFTLIFGELVPKRVAMQKPMQVARIACPVVSAVAFVMKPVVWFLSVSTNLVLRLLRMKTEAEEETVTEEEIRMMVDLGEEKGTIDQGEKEWIENVFDFGDATVYDCMTHASQVRAISLTEEDGAIFNLIRESGLSRYPVYKKDLDDVVGILNARTFLLNRSSGFPTPIEKLIHPAYFVPETLSASTLFRDMQQKKVHLAVVVDEYGQTSGIITMEDLVEEIVGNIYDEFDPDEPTEIEAIGQNQWRLSGSVDVKRLEELFGLHLPEDRDYDTLGGMILSTLAAIPQDGATFDTEICGLNIHVTKIRGHRIMEAVITKPDKVEKTEETDD